MGGSSTYERSDLQDEGISTAGAGAATQRAGRLPASPRPVVRRELARLFDAMHKTDRASLVDSLSLLLPPNVHLDVYNAAFAWMLTVSPHERSMVARAVGPVAEQLSLGEHGPQDDLVRLLERVRNLPEERGPLLLEASMQLLTPTQHGLLPMHVSDSLRVLQPLSDDLVLGTAKQMRDIYGGKIPGKNPATNFFRCVELHVGLAPEASRVLVENAEKLHLAALEGPGFLDPGYLRAMVALLSLPQAEQSLLASQIRILLLDTTLSSFSRGRFAGNLLTLAPEKRAQVMQIARDVLRQGLPFPARWLGHFDEPWVRPFRDPECRSLLFEAISRAPSPENALFALESLMFEWPADARQYFSGFLREVARPELLHQNEHLEDRSGAARGDLRRPSILEPSFREEYVARQRAGQPAAVSTPSARAPRQAAHVGGASDLESVMQARLTRQVDSAAAALRARFPAPIERSVAMRQIEGHLRALRAQLPRRGEHVLLRRRGGDTEINNALRALAGPNRKKDYSLPIREVIDMAALAALVWQATSAARPGIDPRQAARDTDTMRHAFVMALSRCVEDDGHLVCGVGQRQQLVDVLKGYYPEAGDALRSVTPQSLLAVLSQDFYSAHTARDPSAADIADFRRHAEARAKEQFGAQSAEEKQFRRDLDEYMRLTF